MMRGEKDKMLAGELSDARAPEIQAQLAVALGGAPLVARLSP
jgi:hypothetical protein